MLLNKTISKNYCFNFNIGNSGLTAIFVSARCKSKKQTGLNVDEDLRIQINGLNFREIPPQKNIQLFNIPPSFNGSHLKGNKQTIVFFTCLNKGENYLNLIARDSAFVEEIKIQELTGQQDIELSVENKAENGNNIPWFTFVLVDLPLSNIAAELTIERRFWDSDDVKIIIDGDVKKNIKGGKYKFWFLAGGFLRWFLRECKGEKKKINTSLDVKLETGIHYIELWADKTPTLHKVNFSFKHSQTKSEVRAADIIQLYSSIIKDTAREFKVSPIIVGAVIFQEQSTNVNFIDTLSDYIGGLLHLNTSIGVGQVRVETAKALDKVYPELSPLDKNTNIFPAGSNMIEVERLKDPAVNIRYVAAKIKFSQEKWGKMGFDIVSQPEILGTLYNIEDVNKPIEPHAKPSPNSFGVGVKNNYDRVKNLLEL